MREVREEVTESRISHGCGTIEYADRMGLLDHEVIGGHCIWCTEKDIGLMASRDVAVAHNPVANMILASGVCPVPRFQREGLRIGHGQAVDAMINDGLWCTFEDWHMGNAGEVVAVDFGITRRAQDEFAMDSHRKAAEATAAGRFRGAGQRG